MDRPATITSRSSDADRLRLALDAARLGDWSRDAATDLVTLSPRAAEIFGVAADAVITWAELRERLHPDDRERVTRSVETAFANRSDYAVEYRIMTNEGERWVAAHGHATYAENGAVTGTLGIVQDITAEMRTKELLREQAE